LMPSINLCSYFCSCRVSCSRRMQMQVQFGSERKRSQFALRRREIIQVHEEMGVDSSLPGAFPDGKGMAPK